MNASQRRLLLWSVLGGSVLLALVIAFRPQALPVDMQIVERDSLVVTVDEEGETVYDEERCCYVKPGKCKPPPCW